MRQCMDVDNPYRRLKKIIGQVQAIDRMVDEDVPCEDVLSQINAAKSASTSVGRWWRGTSSTVSGTASSTGMRTRPSRASPRRWSGSPTWVEARDRLKADPLCICYRIFQSVIGQYLSAAGHLLFLLSIA